MLTLALKLTKTITLLSTFVKLVVKPNPKQSFPQKLHVLVFVGL